MTDRPAAQDRFIPSPFQDPVFVAAEKKSNRRIKEQKRSVHRDLAALSRIAHDGGPSSRSFILAYRILARCSMLVVLCSTDLELEPLCGAYKQIVRATDDTGRRAGLIARAQALIEYAHVTITPAQFDLIVAAMIGPASAISAVRWEAAFIKNWALSPRHKEYWEDCYMPRIRILRSGAMTASARLPT